MHLLACVMGLAAGGVACSPIPFEGLGSAGVTAGGQQDIAAARTVIDDGGVPDPESITVEGFLSEHGIPIPEPQVPRTLYATASSSWHRDFDAFTPLATLDIGFGTNIDRGSFARNPLNLVVVIDKSGSMGDFLDARSRTSKLDAVKIAVDRLLAQLTADDLISIVSFTAEPAVRLEAASGDDVVAVKNALDDLAALGGTDLASGLSRGYRVARRNQDDSRAGRLIVFTDALLTDRNERSVRNFLDTMEAYAREEIGATIFGVGSDFGHEVANDISQIRGGNYFFLDDYERIVSVFDEDFDFLVTPVAYDVSLTITVPFAFDVVDVYGIPDAGPISHAMEMTIPTLFLSNRQGGGTIMARLRAGALVKFVGPNTLAEIGLEYTRPDGIKVRRSTVTASLPAGLDPDAVESYFESDAARRASLLLNTALVLKATCEDAYFSYADYWYYYSPPDRTRAVERLQDFLPYFDEQAAMLEDSTGPNSRSLSQERALLEQLLQNIEDRMW